MKKGLSRVERLRRLVVDVASPDTLTCIFVPGGRLRGAGIVSDSYCATCNQSVMWHEVAAAIPLVAFAEQLQALGVTPAGLDAIADYLRSLEDATAVKEPV